MSDDFAKVLIVFIVIGLPILLGVGSGVIKQWLRLRERQLELQAQQTAEKAAQYAAQTERLEQRVRVLERIATDKGIVLAEEIDRLRDAPLN